jgi:hypothetical protein
MADITMCSGGECPMKERCYRFTATKNEWRQSFFLGIPIKEDKTCDHFWDNQSYTREGIKE